MTTAAVSALVAVVAFLAGFRRGEIRGERVGEARVLRIYEPYARVQHMGTDV